MGGRFHRDLSVGVDGSVYYLLSCVEVSGKKHRILSVGVGGTGRRWKTIRKYTNIINQSAILSHRYNRPTTVLYFTTVYYAHIVYMLLVYFL